MRKEILSVVESVSNEKSIPKEKIFSALEVAIATAIKKKFTKETEIRVNINQKSGIVGIFRRWIVVDNVTKSTREISVEKAKMHDPLVEIGDYIEKEVKSIVFDRISTQAAKQIIVQKVREAEKLTVINQFKKYEGKIITGTIKKIHKNRIILDLGKNAEASIKKEEILPRENLRMGDRIRGILYISKKKTKNAQLLVSRTKLEMLKELFRIEVPEINEEIVEIKSVSRDPGFRSKIAVKTNDGRVDPIGACIGMRGSRVQAVSNALNGERIDVILWDEDPAQFVVNSLSPYEISSMVIEEKSNSIDIAVKQDDLLHIVGKNGQNVRLISQLIGWKINILTTEEFRKKRLEETEETIKNFVHYLDLDKETASLLIEEGISSLEELAYVPIEELLKIKTIEEDIIKTIRKKSKDVLTTIALKEEENLNNISLIKDLLQMKKIEENVFSDLTKKGISTLEGLAEQSIFDLSNIRNLSNKDAGDLIMAAREICWFRKEKDENIGK